MYIMSKIGYFRGKYNFLSNFYPTQFEHDGLIFQNSEQAYQYYKAENDIDKQNVLNITDPKKVKAYGHRIKMSDIKSFDRTKLILMYDILYSKFKNPDLRKKLLDTNDMEIIEGNYWCDNFYGACNCNKCKDKIKHNNLGKILMKLRTAIREEIAKN